MREPRSIRQFHRALRIGAMIVPLLALLLFAWPQNSAAQAPPPAAAPTQSASVATHPAQEPFTGYALPPDLYRKAHHLGQIEFWGAIVSFLYSVLILLIVLQTRLAPKFRDWAERATKLRFVQSTIFAPLLIIALDVLGLPVDAAEHWISRKFGLSVQSWPSWFADWSKSALLVIVLATFLVWLLYVALRRSPRRWWFYFWIATIPITIFLVFVQPVFVDPLFHKFEPLAQKDAPLAAALEKMVQRTGENIPESRMYWMAASEKTNELNAYVTGIGASKRIVVWDTTIARLDTPQTVFVVGHEMGHYVLNHIPKGIAAGEAFLLVVFYLGYLALNWLLSRWGPRWGIREASDWASLPALLLLLTIFSFAANPIVNAFSRHIEHQADQYGLEVTHGLTPDSSRVAAQSFQILGKIDLSDPAPNPVDVFMFYSHPTIAERIHFALTYDPWSHGGRGQFVKENLYPPIS
ncbi:MAG TPA: M48 family metallopeptidase [Candidatus Acidoferrales bacterium]|nr:M48 family metallopeptidase [Candidatus Acidoferrales bacterium]